MANEDNKDIRQPGRNNWSLASVATACAVVLGIYLGSGIWENSSTVESTDIVDEFSEAFYQSGFADDLNASIQKGD